MKRTPKTEKGGTYLIRNFPPDLKKAAQHRAVEEGKTLRHVILEALRRHVG